MPHLRTKLGDFGEQTAAMYFTRLGMPVVARKWRCAAGEIDLIVRDGAALVFVEVRTRRGAPGNAAESVGLRKQERLIALAYAYLDTHSTSPDTPWRIDVVAIDVDRFGAVANLNHIRDAVEEH
ncbi:MAG: YraN family protein [Blastochloris sp.]|nr:YraN family protein [Blastochloris sp.]